MASASVHVQMIAFYILGLIQYKNLVGSPQLTTPQHSQYVQSTGTRLMELEFSFLLFILVNIFLRSLLCCQKVCILVLE